jgi:hypothetical protein
VERPRRKVRFARLIQQRGRVVGVPAVRAAYGGDLNLPWLPRTVVWAAGAVLSMGRCQAVWLSVG